MPRSDLPNRRSLPWMLLTVMLVAACSERGALDLSSDVPSSPTVPAEQVGKSVPAGAPVARPDPPPDLFTGDLAALKKRGRLRILIPANVGGAFYLPREGWPVEAQHAAAERFARNHGMQPELVPVASFADMIPSLLSGRGDLIAANLTVTEQRRGKIAFSVPITTVRQQVLVAHDNQDIKQLDDLAGKRVMLDRGSSFWERMEVHRARLPGIELIPRPAEMTDEEELDQVASGRVDASIRDSNVASMYLNYRDDLRHAFDLPGIDDIAWGLRPDAHKLRAALNKYLHLEFVADAGQARFKGDWKEIVKRRVLRVVMPNNAASYFLHRGELQGFEYELAKAFADANKLRLEVLVPETHEQLLDWLIEGRADIAAGFLDPESVTGVRAAAVAFSRPYHYAARHLVVAAGDQREGLAALNGSKVTVRRSSPYWNDLQRLQGDGARFELVAAAEDTETEELIAQVAQGEIDATVADGHLLDIELARGLNVKSGFVLSDERPHAAAVRAGNPVLLENLNSFVKKQYRGLVYNILYKKYFTNSSNVRDLAAGRVGGGGNGLSPYDTLTRKYAEKYGFDWRLITAQMYQESRFDPNAKSFAGARGLMQVMPRTAKFMGFEQIEEPEDSIHAGVKYLDWVRNRFEDSLPFNERLWFTLAAYNAGHGHVDDARRLARQQGLDGDSWFGNTEKAMLLLSKNKYAKKARYGYVRGIEPVSYVRDIRTRYRAYADIAEKRLSGTQGTAADGRLVQVASAAR
ncbi:MAG: transporter substrate-binding domain-containing protein [Gammaproteobacteria bacterium]|nr:transporter substrate-binding domain-containing protein [Gammaproteobacteria bacterium]